MTKLTSQAKKSSNSDETHNIVRYGLMLAYLRKGDFTRAQTQLDQLLEARPDHPLKALSQAELALASGKLKQAENAYAALYEIDRNSIVNIRGYAQALLQNKNYPRAIRVLRKNLRRAPDQLWAYELLAQAYGEQGNTQNALFNQAQRLHRSGQYTKALSLLEQQSSATHSDQSAYLSASIDSLREQIEQAKQRLEDFKL